MNAIVTTNDASSSRRTARTNSFGYFRFDDFAVGQTYIFNVSGKNYLFFTQAISLTADLTELNFTAQ